MPGGESNFNLNQKVHDRKRAKGDTLCELDIKEKWKSFTSMPYWFLNELKPMLEIL